MLAHLLTLRGFAATNLIPRNTGRAIPGVMFGRTVLTTRSGQLPLMPTCIRRCRNGEIRQGLATIASTESDMTQNPPRPPARRRPSLDEEPEPDEDPNELPRVNINPLYTAPAPIDMDSELGQVLAHVLVYSLRELKSLPWWDVSRQFFDHAGVDTTPEACVEMYDAVVAALRAHDTPPAAVDPIPPVKPGRTWRQEEDQKLYQMWRGCFSLPKISKLMGRSEQSCRGRVSAHRKLQRIHGMQGGKDWDWKRPRDLWADPGDTPLIEEFELMLIELSQNDKELTNLVFPVAPEINAKIALRKSLDI
ncbi:hypothetical protein HKX48_005587 [Thoreauomyces humboldtii]|nr:hypothetical protein HKX48_005587 [Thoreauomyces humboldtii]